MSSNQDELRKRKIETENQEEEQRKKDEVDSVEQPVATVGTSLLFWCYFRIRKEKIEEAIRHVKLVCELKGENRGVLEARKHIAWYIKGMPGAPKLRDTVNRIDSVEEMRKLLIEQIERS